MDSSIVPQNNKKLGGIYQIRQLSTGKKYIGSGTNLSRRLSRHRSELNCNRHANHHLQNAWVKHGEADFLFEVLEIVDISEGKQRLIEREQWYLDNCVAWKFDFNIAPTAYSPAGIPPTDETLEKIRKAVTGRKISESGRQSLRDSWSRRKEQGFQVSEEARKNQSAARKGKKYQPLSEEAKQNLRDGWQRRREQGLKKAPVTDETKRRMSKAQQRRKEQGWKAPPISEETRKKKSESQKAIRKAKREAKTNV